MSNYYTTINLEDGFITGTVFNARTNLQVYKTKPYPTQSQVTRDITAYLVNSTSKEKNTQPPEQTQTVVNVVKSTATLPVRSRQQRCCGR